MKALVNGGLNLSELDGWWAEAFTPDVGWAIGDGGEHSDVASWDAIEAKQLYDVLEKEVVPEFYRRDDRGIPTQWLARMRASMSLLTPRYSAARTVREYTEQHYIPAAIAYRDRAAYGAALGATIVNWEHSLREKWGSLSFGKTKVRNTETEREFEVEVSLDGLAPSYVRVELYAEASGSEPAVRQELFPADPASNDPSADSAGCVVYRGSVPATRPAADFTPRMLPKHASVAVPLEVNFIRWADNPGG
jgi:starch phosphorylase